MFCCIARMAFIQDARKCDVTSKIFRLSTFFLRPFSGRTALHQNGGNNQ